MAKSNLKPLVNYAKYEALGAQLLGYEIAISSFFEALARTDHATAKAVAQAIRGHSGRIDPKKFPGLREKCVAYAELLESNLRPATH